ncbi:flagellar basal body P-ring formation chaperone FlgA [Bordetella hinzii]|uniref:Flagella basal body P-ring formation protein FlgA n=2 Tax=Bordetella hinzii TaxID=103855 RepID=A0AAN1RYL3_9BORD|nr:flagellar basal body P-ring formation chaperone FlgA [Bordetella hinzii]KCB29959.1 flagella basal body P-ring formation protein FlgA [Bordetella hinzii L60]AKQ56002.1 Flagella basal body P-ring formation protein FlgA precursor [Bordetella hinzii]AKQ60534.1 Flagella basal body P-ring formation protein FlgA precursor [Bordetella hinzii]AZW18424.1 flagellar basal body P-ring formation protein FlgA [Bordetella hinzii]KCB34246.1 flagella basal body P-ring formation protein FlgA [Bordetella hinzi
MQFRYWPDGRRFYNLVIMRAALTSIALLYSGLALTSPAAHAQATESPENISRAAEAFLKSQLAPGQASVVMDPVKNDRLPACDALSPFMPGALRPRARMTVGVRCAAPHNWTAYVQASVSMTGTYYVAGRQIPPGKTIGPEDLDAREGDLIALPAGVMTDTARILGMQARHRINAGQPIRGSALRNADAIARGQNVRIIARGNGFTVSSEGQAMDDAPPGATVQVRTASGQIVSGVVQSAGQVEVQL